MIWYQEIADEQAIQDYKKGSTPSWAPWRRWLRWRCCVKLTRSSITPGTCSEPTSAPSDESCLPVRSDRAVSHAGRHWWSLIAVGSRDQPPRRPCVTVE